jgi:ABC-type branched-subunit amino acid transport system substrate-binding protein/predicted negative regulator of RcsB-dependent stress response
MPDTSVRQPGRRPALVLLLALACLFMPQDGPFFLGRSLTTAAPGKTEATSGPKKHPAQAALEQAKTLVETHEEATAIEELQRLIAAYPRSDYVDDAYLLLAAAYTNKKQFADAVATLELLLTEYPDSDLTGRARVALGRTYVLMGNTEQALSVLAEARALSSEVETQRDALKAMGEIQVQRGDTVRAVQTWLDEQLLTPEDQRDDVRGRIIDLVQKQTDRKTLTRLRDIYPMSFPGDLALIRLAEIYQARGEDHLAERTLLIFLNRFPNHEYASTAAETLKSFSTKIKSSQQLLVAVLPLSGRLGQFGTESLYGIRLALDKARDSLSLPSVGLIVKDSESGKPSFRNELSALLNEHRPMAVIGPMLSRNLQLLAGLAEQAQVPFITPAATQHDVRRYGTYVFNTALTYPLQTRRIVDHAMGKLGLQRFCVLYPDTNYGQEMARLFSQEVRAKGGDIIAMEAYKETASDFGPEIKRLKAEDLKRDGRTTEVKLEKGGMRINYTPGFDAIYLPGESEQIALLAPQLAFYDIKVPLLGSNGWNSPQLLRFPDRSLEGSIFVDAYFADSADPVMREFVQQYLRKYQSSPSLFAVQAYDAARLVLEAMRKGATSGTEVRDYLAQVRDLPSLGGPAAFGPAGTLERHVFLIQVKNGKLVQIE